MGAKAYMGRLISHTTTSFRKTRKYIKRSTARAMRRAGKALDDAPRRVVTGWTD